VQSRLLENLGLGERSEFVVLGIDSERPKIVVRRRFASTVIPRECFREVFERGIACAALGGYARVVVVCDTERRFFG
jgi:hypothetical protein